jgi:cytochrome c oxidase assembly protein subunit 15
MSAPQRAVAVRPDGVAALAWRPTAPTVRRTALAALIANVAIVITGGLVRLTDSGLGCPSWPDCAGSSLVPTRALSWHKYVEFGNRMVTFVVFAAALAAFAVVLRARPRPARTLLWAWIAPLGIVAQAVMGGILVLTNLNPWWVSAHFLLSMLLIAAATVLWWRTRVGPDAGSAAERRPPPPGVVRWLARATFATVYAVFAIGTLVTGSGPHAGDATAPRSGLRSSSMAQLHADVVMLLVGLAIGLAIAATAIGAEPALRIATRVLVGALAFQAAVGFAQYFDHLPIGLVELHLAGAALIAAAATAVTLAAGDGLAVTRDVRSETLRHATNPARTA